MHPYLWHVQRIILFPYNKCVQTRINGNPHCESWPGVVLGLANQHEFGANCGAHISGLYRKACEFIAKSPKLEEVQHINKPSEFLASLNFCQYVAILDLDQILHSWASTLAKAHVSFDSSVAPKEFRPSCRTELFSCGIWGPWKDWDQSPCQRELLQKYCHPSFLLLPKLYQIEGSVRISPSLACPPQPSYRLQILPWRQRPS